MSHLNYTSSSAPGTSKAMAKSSSKETVAQWQENQDISFSTGLPSHILSKLQLNFEADPKNKLSQNMVTSNHLLSVCLDHKVVSQTNHVYQQKMPAEGRPMTDQGDTKNCWVFAYLNAMRVSFIEKFELKGFEFSEAYLCFWYKIERAYYLLNAYEDRVAKRKEPVDSRLFQFLLADPMTDGGQWGMLTNLINKYGVMPMEAFPYAFDNKKFQNMNKVLNYKLRSFAMQLCSMVGRNASQDELDREKLKMVEEVHRVTSICLGSPPKTFTWEYYDKSNNYKKIGPITPLQFYNEHVKPLYNVDDKVYLLNDCRSEVSFGKLYTVEFLGSMVGGRKILSNNQPIDVLKTAAAGSIKAGEPVWGVCDVVQFVDYKRGIMDLEIHDFDLVLGMSMKKDIDKAQTLMFSRAKHVMTFTVFTEADGVDEKHVKWRAESPSGESYGDKGYLIMTDDWFTQYVFGVVVDKKFVPDDIMAVFQQEPVVLPAWDPLGRLE